MKPSTAKLAGKESVSNSPGVIVSAAMNRQTPFKKALGVNATDAQREGVDKAAFRKVVRS